MTDEEANTLRIQNDQLRHDAAHVLNELDRLRAERDELVAAIHDAVDCVEGEGTRWEEDGHEITALSFMLVGRTIRNRTAALLAHIRATTPGATVTDVHTEPEADHDGPPGSQRV